VRSAASYLRGRLVYGMGLKRPRPELASWMSCQGLRREPVARAFAPAFVAAKDQARWRSLCYLLGVKGYLLTDREESPFVPAEWH
jgi:hypothetical protein